MSRDERASSCSSSSTATVECNNACGRLPLHRDDSFGVSFVLELVVQQSGAITVREQGISNTCFSKSPKFFCIINASGKNVARRENV